MSLSRQGHPKIAQHLGAGLMDECDLVSPVRDERQRSMFCRPSRDLLVTFASPPARTCWAIVESSLAGLAGREIAGEPVGVSPRTHPRCELSGGERRPARRLAFEPNITGEPPGRRVWKPLRVPQRRERVEELVVVIGWPSLLQAGCRRHKKLRVDLQTRTTSFPDSMSVLSFLCCASGTQCRSSHI